MRRQIIYSDAFHEAADAFGGYEELDKALDTVMEVLAHNPYALPRFESDFVSFRWVRTEPIGELPRLAILFTIDAKGNVTLEDIQEISVF
jgi:hypothetical protein